VPRQPYIPPRPPTPGRPNNPSGRTLPSRPMRPKARPVARPLSSAFQPVPKRIAIGSKITRKPAGKNIMPSKPFGQAKIKPGKNLMPRKPLGQAQIKPRLPGFAARRKPNLKGRMG